jgi:general secretion pathway protein J
MRNKKAGLTLIEVLVAVSLLSLLSVGILMALRVGAGAWERANSALMLDRRIAAANRIFHAELEGIFPAWAEFQDPTTQAPVSFLLFQGQPESMRFVTSYSLDGGPRAGLRLVELQVTATARGRRVLLNEETYSSPRVGGRIVSGLARGGPSPGLRILFAPIVPQPSSLIIADELESCSFSYLLDREPMEPQKWISAWEEPYFLPAAVSIQISARQDSGRLRPVSVTVPIRSTMLSP